MGSTAPSKGPPSIWPLRGRCLFQRCWKIHHHSDWGQYTHESTSMSPRGCCVAAPQEECKLFLHDHSIVLGKRHAISERRWRSVCGSKDPNADAHTMACR